MNRRTILVIAAAAIAAGISWQINAQQTPSTQERLRASGLGVAPGTVMPAWPAAPNPLDRIAPVSDAMLTNPPAGDWLTWRRTYD